MRRILILIILIPSISIAQKTRENNLQVGPVASFYNGGGAAFGGELIGNMEVQENALLGIGTQVLKFKSMSSVCVPLFCSMKILFPTKKAEFFLHLNPGYGFYSHSEVKNVFVAGSYVVENSTRKGGFYFGAGMGLHSNKKTSPYLNIQYSRYQFKSTYSTNTQATYETSSIDAITFTCGIWIK